MKKILIILILSFTFFTNAKTAVSKNLNVSIGCYTMDGYLRHLDKTKDDFFRGYLLDTRTWDGQKGPEFNLLITMENKRDENSSDDKWQGEIIYLDHTGKKKFRLKGLSLGGYGQSIDFAITAVSNNSTTSNTEILNITPWETSETKEEYYEVEYTKIENIKEALSKRDKQLNLINQKDFIVFSQKYICLK